MKRRNYFWVFITFLFLIVLAACSSKTTGSQSTINSLVQTPVLAETPSSGTQLSATQTIDGDALILEKLQNHHSIDRVYGAKHTRDEWNATIDRMIGYGAKISEDEKKIIIDYLLSRK